MTELIAEFRVAGGEWEVVDNPTDNCVIFMMEDQSTKYCTFDTEEGKVEYRIREN